MDNSAKPEGNTQPASGPAQKPVQIDCEDKVKNEDWDKCMVAELCAMVKAYNESPQPKVEMSLPARPTHPLNFPT